ncbi:hypothetical protein L9F63_008006 [Diploptera punctata]|uniref:Protein artemis n=1 Tax=Diploptera punctata TaxID=6984 RepID=A0AAD7Z6U6_DIPPU|nr:hypothetical protein L9F63_008006 [Diploptera punctata]
MSCFEGHVEELKNVSIDYFENNNIYSKTFFLSHCHSDHMAGLRSYTFLNRLKEEPQVFLYCSEITAHILKSEKTFTDLSHKIRDLLIGPGNLVTIPGNNGEEDQDVTVTLIPTGHCPGAVMFLFEGDVSVGHVLYTGDFRIVLGDAAKFKQLHYSDGTVKEIDKLYLDTTFLSQQYRDFPARKDSIAIISNFVALWLAKGEDHHVIIQIPAKYGSEAIFMMLAKQFGMKVHVSDEVYNIYKNMSEIRDAVTNDTMITRIHACPSLRRLYQKNGELTLLPCRVDWFKLVTIRPCALSFTSDMYKGNLESAVLRSEEDNLIRVCYSCHSSHEELKYFISYLKPKQIKACVVPLRMSEIQTLNMLRKMCLPIYGKDNMPVLTVSKRKETPSINVSPKANNVKTLEECLSDEMEFTEMPSSSQTNVSDRRSLKEYKDNMESEEEEENVVEIKSMSTTDVLQTDADIYRLIAEDLQPKSGDQDADIRQSMSLAFLQAAVDKKKPVIYN